MRWLSGFRLVILRNWSALPTRPPQRMMTLLAGAKGRSRENEASSLGLSLSDSHFCEIMLQVGLAGLSASPLEDRLMRKDSFSRLGIAGLSVAGFVSALAVASLGLSADAWSAPAAAPAAPVTKAAAVPVVPTKPTVAGSAVAVSPRAHETCSRGTKRRGIAIGGGKAARLCGFGRAAASHGRQYFDISDSATASGPKRSAARAAGATGPRIATR